MHCVPLRPSVAPLVGVATVLALVAGCTPPSSDGGKIIVTTDDRVEEVRAAREALAAPVPVVTTEAERVVAALEGLWTQDASVEQRAERAEALRLSPFREAVDGLEEVELEGIGPDVVAAREVVAAIVADGRALLAAVEEEVASLTAVADYDRELEDLLVRWDQRGSYSQQLEAFAELVTEAEALAEEIDGRAATPACTGLWQRRAEAAAVVAERTEELRGLIRDRRGEEFDATRDAYRQDPYGFGELLGALDAQAARSCWAEASDATSAVARLAEQTDQLAQVLDPEELRG